MRTILTVCTLSAFLLTASLSFAELNEVSHAPESTSTLQKIKDTSGRWIDTAGQKSKEAYDASKKEAGKIGDASKEKWEALRNQFDQYKLQSPITKKASPES